MQSIKPQPLNYEFSRLLEPKARIRCAESIQVETEDALSGQISAPGDRRDKQAVPYSNPVTGPIYIEDAMPGDTLAVHLHEIRSRDNRCATYTGAPKQLCEWLGTDVPHGAHVCPIVDNTIHWSEQITIPMEPMLGCMATAPEWGVPTTVPAHRHGGNMDIVEVAPGSIVYLPVSVEGALLYVGDAHAAMGHGELSATGLEMASLTTLSCDLIKGLVIPCPRIETAEEIMTVISGCPMERSLAEAFAQLILWMEQDYSWNRWKAYDLLTHVARTSIGYYAFGTVAVKISKRYLAVR